MITNIIILYVFICVSVCVYVRVRAYVCECLIATMFPAHNGLPHFCDIKAISAAETRVVVSFWWAVTRDSPRSRDVIIDKSTGQQTTIRLYDSSTRALYVQFKNVHPDLCKSVGFSRFKDIKPCFCRRMNPRHRSTCLCIYHANCTLLANALSRFKRCFLLVEQPDPRTDNRLLLAANKGSAHEAADVDDDAYGEKEEEELEALVEQTRKALLQSQVRQEG